MATDINLTPTADMPPVTTETGGVTKGATEGTSGVLPSLAADQALGADIAATQDQAAAQQKVGEAIQQGETAKAAGAEAQASAEAQAASEAAAVRDAYLARVARAQAATDAEEQKVKDFQFHDYWATKTTGQKLVSKLAQAFGAFSAGMLGGPNFALQKIQADIQRDFDAQKLALASRERVAAMRRQGVTDLYSAMQHDLAALEVKHSAALKSVAAKAQAEAIRNGVPLQVAQNSVVVQGLMEQAAAKKLSATQRYEQQFHNEAQRQTKQETQVTSAKGRAGQGVEADKNAANFAVLKEHGTWLANEMPKLSADDVRAINEVMKTEDFLQGDGTVKTAINAAAAKLGFDPETGISSTAKEYLDRVRRAAEGLGRVQSGAAIGSVENKRFVDSLMPKVSDSPEDLSKRAGRIVTDINARGQFLERPPRAKNAAPATDPKAELKMKILKTAQWVQAHPGDPRVGAARRAIANMNQQLGAQ
ncbi:MAG TPA: hypothetical protein VI384_04485 [Candidatus Dormibacteraeota bacterium]